MLPPVPVFIVFTEFKFEPSNSLKTTLTMTIKHLFSLHDPAQPMIPDNTIKAPVPINRYVAKGNVLLPRRLM